jgi:hypothetical protein
LNIFFEALSHLLTIMHVDEKGRAILARTCQNLGWWKNWLRACKDEMNPCHGILHTLPPSLKILSSSSCKSNSEQCTQVWWSPYLQWWCTWAHLKSINQTEPSSSLCMHMIKFSSSNCLCLQPVSFTILAWLQFFQEFSTDSSKDKFAYFKDLGRFSRYAPYLVNESSDMLEKAETALNTK